MKTEMKTTILNEDINLGNSLPYNIGYSDAIIEGMDGVAKVPGMSHYYIFSARGRRFVKNVTHVEYTDDKNAFIKAMHLLNNTDILNQIQRNLKIKKGVN